MAKGKINLQAADGAVIGLVVPDGLTSGERQIALGVNLSGITAKIIKTMFSHIATFKHQKTVDGWQYSLNGMLNLVQYLIKNIKYARRKNVISK